MLIVSDLNSIHTKRWVRALYEKGVNVCVFGLSAVTDDYYQDIDVRIESANLQVSKFGNLFEKAAYLSAVKQLRAVYKEFIPDIVHAHYATSYGLLGSFLRHHPYAISVWGADVYDFPNESGIKRSLLKRNLKHADYLFSTSKVMAEETKKYTDKVITVVPFGVDVDVFKPKPKGLDNDALVFGIVKALEDKYGIEYLIRAFKMLMDKYPEKHHRLLIVGRGSKEKKLKDLCIELEVSERIDFAGFVSHDKVVSYFHRMDVVVVPSILDSESFGVAAVEASACEKPVVVSNVGGLPEVILDKKTGLIVPAKDPAELFLAMDYFINNTNRIEVYGKAGRENVLLHYNWNDNVDLMIQQYERMLIR